MPSSRIRSSSRTSAESESNSPARATAHSARCVGVHTFPGRLPRSRASRLPPVIAAASARVRRTAARPPGPPPDEWTATRRSRGPESLSFSDLHSSNR